MASNRRVFIYDPSKEALREEVDANAGVHHVRILSYAFGLGLALTFTLGRGKIAGSFVYVVTSLGVAALLAVMILVLARHDTFNSSSEHEPLISRLAAAVRSLWRRHTIPDVMLRRALDIALSVTGTGLVFSVLQAWIDSHLAVDSATQTALWLEQTSIWLRSMNPVTHFLLKTPKWIEAAAIAILTAASASIPIFAQLTLGWSRASRWLSRSYVVLTVIASITFFGHQHGQVLVAEAARLNAERENIRDDYAATRDEVEAALVNIAAEEAVNATPSAHQWAHAETKISTARIEAQHVRQLGAGSTPRFREWQARFEAAASPELGTSREARITTTTGSAPIVADRAESADSMPNAWSQTMRTEVKRDVEASTAAVASHSGAGPLSQVQAKVADAIHSELKERVVKRLLGTVGLPDDLTNLVLDPLLHTPLKEWLKLFVNDAVNSVIMRRETFKQVSDRFRTVVRERFSREPGFHPMDADPVVTSVTRYENDAAALLSEIGDLVLAANAEINARRERLLSSESDGRWGSLRRRADDIFRASRYDSDQKALALGALSRWNDRKMRLARVAASASNEVAAIDWEAEFFGYMAVDPALAATWGYLVIATQEVLREDAIPEDGMTYYAETAGVGTAATVRALYSSSAVVDAIDALCPKTHPPGKKDPLEAMIRRSRSQSMTEGGSLRRFHY